MKTMVLATVANLNANWGLALGIHIQIFLHKSLPGCCGEESFFVVLVFTYTLFLFWFTGNCKWLNVN